MELHNTNLKFMCRVCGKWLGKKQYPMSINLKIKIEEVFFVKLTDIENVHPKRICHKCYCTVNNVSKRKKTTSVTLFSGW